MNKVGVFSGSFDPVHIGHIESCLVAKSVCELDDVYLLLEKNPQRKTNLANYSHRMEMLKIATRDYPSIKLEQFNADNITTSECLKFLKTRNPESEYWYIFGSDILEHLKNWSELDLLLSNFKLCVVLRSNSKRSATEKLLNEIVEDKTTTIVLPEVYSEVSSTIVKNALPNALKYLDEKVQEYILANNLYSKDSSK